MAGYKSRNSLKDLRAVLALQDYYRALEERKNRLFNYLFRRHPLFITSVWFRIFYLLFFTWLFFGHGSPGKQVEEIVQSEAANSIHRIMGSSRTFSSMYTGGSNVLVFVTNKGRYEARRDFAPLPHLYKGDTVIIQYTFFGKATRFKSLHGSDLYDLWTSWVLIFFVGFITMASFVAYQGGDYTTKLVIWNACIADVLVLIYYFFFG